jgi:predicted nuclease of predicted toxin-antitoxin system
MEQNPVFFIDRCLGKITIAEMLRNDGESIEIHDDNFKQDALDEDWLPLTAQRGWIVLTKDENIGRNPLEIEAIKASSARVFVLSSKRLNGNQQGAAFKDALPKMKKFIQDNSAPFIAKVYVGGIVRSWKPPF